MNEAVNIVLSRIEGGRTWLASIVGSGRAIGLGATPGEAVDELFRWRIASEPAAPSPGGDG